MDFKKQKKPQVNFLRSYTHKIKKITEKIKLVLDSEIKNDKTNFQGD